MRRVALRSKSLFSVIILIASLLYRGAFGVAYAESGANKNISALVSGLKSQIGISVIDLDSNGQTIFEYKSKVPLKPASVLKVVTSAAVLSRLGPEHVIATKIFADGLEKGVAKTLYIQGAGDPSLNIEAAWLMARQLKTHGLKKFIKLVLDDSLFSESRTPVGQRAFQTGSSALSFNYNSIGITVCPGELGDSAKIQTDPWEVGATIKNEVKTVSGSGQVFSVSSIDRKKQPFAFAVKGKIGRYSECETVFRSVENPVNYFGATFLSLIKSIGIDAPKGFEIGVVPKSSELLLTHESKEAKHLVEDLNHFSNNFIGEQLLYILGDKFPQSSSEDAPGRFDLSLGVKRLGDYLLNLGCSEDEFALFDGSGLSHANRLSPRVVTRILQAVFADDAIRPEFENSLSVALKSGTLKKRAFEPPGIILRGKTGTLDGVSSLAGYLITDKGKRLAFAILQNGVPSKDQAVATENKIVHLLFSS